MSSPLTLGWPALAVLVMFGASLVAQQKRIRLPLQEMATHPRFLAWRIPWTEETGGIQSTGSKIAGFG